MTAGIRIKSAQKAQSSEPVGLVASLTLSMATSLASGLQTTYPAACDTSGPYNSRRIPVRCDQQIPNFIKPYYSSSYEATIPNSGSLSVVPFALDGLSCSLNNPEFVKLGWTVTDEIRKPTHRRTRMELENRETGGKYTITGEFFSEDEIPLNKRDVQMLLTTVGLFTDGDRQDFFDYFKGGRFDASRGEMLGRAVLQQYGLRAKLEHKDLVRAAELYAVLATSKLSIQKATQSEDNAYFSVSFMEDHRSAEELQAERNCLMRDAFFILWNEGVNVHDKKGRAWAGCVADEGGEAPLEKWQPRTRCRDEARWGRWGGAKPKRPQGGRKPEGNVWR